MTIGEDVDRPNLPLWDRTINQAILRKGGTLRILAGHLHRGDFDPSSCRTKLPVSRPVFGRHLSHDYPGSRLREGFRRERDPCTSNPPCPVSFRSAALLLPSAHRPVGVYDKLMVFRGSSLTGLTQIQIGNCLVIKRPAVWPSRGHRRVQA